MKRLTRNEKIRLMVIEASSVFLSVFLNQMITTVFPAYQSVQSAAPARNASSKASSNCTIDDPSNVYVALLIGSKYCTELVILPIVGWLADRYHAPLILFYGALVEALACIIYSLSGNFYSTMLARVTDAVGYSIVSASGLTLVYTVYLTERPRSRMITIDSIVVYIASAISPFIAGSVFESAVAVSHSVARIATFMMICPLFVLLAIAIAPFAFEMSYLSIVLRICGKRSDPGLEKKESADRFIAESEPTNQIAPVDAVAIETKDIVHDKSVLSDDDVEVRETLNIVTLLRDPHIMIILLGLLFNSLIYNSLETTLPIFMIRKFCSDQQQQGVVWLFGALSLVGFLVSSLLFQYKPRLCCGVPIIGVVVTGSLCVVLAFCNPWWVIGICLAVMMFFGSMMEVLIIPVIPQIIDSKYSRVYGSGSGLTLVTYTISGIIGSFPIGPLVEQFGFLTMCCILCSINYVMAPFFYFLRPYFNISPSKH